METKDYLIMLVLVSLIVFTFSLGYMGLQGRYGFPVDASSMGKINTLNSMNETYALAQEMKGNLTESNVLDLTSLSAFAQIGYKVILMPIKSFKIVSGMAQSMMEVIGIPTIFYYALMSILFIFVIFSIINYLFKVQ